MNKIIALIGCCLMFGCVQQSWTLATFGMDERSAQKGPIKIGYVIPLSGQAAEPGKLILEGAKLYLDKIHNKMSGRDVVFIVEDDGSTNYKSVDIVNKLASENKVDLMSGVFLTSSLYAIAPVVEKLEIPFVVVSSGADNLSQRDHRHWFVRCCYTGSQPAHPFGEYAYKKLGYRRVVTLASNYGYGYEAVGGFQRTFEDCGGKVVQKLWAPVGFKEFGDIIKQIRPDADAIFLCAVGQSAVAIDQEIRKYGPKLPLIGLTASFDESYYPRLNDDLVGAISASLYSTALKSKQNEAFVAEFRGKYNADPSYFAEHGYTAMMLIDRAIANLNGDISNKEKLLESLKRTKLPDAPRGPVEIDAYGSAVQNVYIRKTERVNGKLQNTVIQAYPHVSQFWKWNPDDYMAKPRYDKDFPPCTYCSP